MKNEILEQFEKDIRDKKVAIIGLGVSNIPLVDYMYEKGANVTVFDNRKISELSDEVIDKLKKYKFEYVGGKDNLQKLKGFDIIFRSPSCLPTKPELEAEAKRGAIVTTEIEMLMKMCPCKIIGVTGSDGKTTTTSLIAAILKKAGLKTYLGGNIGTPLFTKLSEMEVQDIVVLELSSFQLMGMKVSPNISVITNITPNHLNVHKDYDEYIDAKKNIFKYQNKDGITVLNYDNEITRKCIEEVNGNVVLFSRKQRLDNGFIVENNVIKEVINGKTKDIIEAKDIKLRGQHNYEDIATALAATKTLVSQDIAFDAIKEFTPVEHRLEIIREIDGVKWYNDSVSSSPTRTIAGLNAYDEEIVLIAGGYDKNLDYTPIAKPILEHVKILILLGQTSEKIYNAVVQEETAQGKEIEIYKCESLEETVETAKRCAKPGQVVLFSPASASFDMFKDFADRGRKFKDLVNKI